MNPNIKKLLILNNHGFTDQGMIHLLNLVSLEQLDLRGELLTLIGFERIAGLRNLKSLEFLQATQLDNQGLARLATLPQLKSLTFFSQGVTTSGVTQLKSLNDLVKFEAEGARPDGTVLDISALSQLETLKISPVSDDDLACLEGLKSLKWLEIGGPGLTNKGLNHLRSLLCLRVLKVWPENQVTEDALKALGRDRPSLRWEQIRSAP
jgi:hypothetical protein